MVAPVRRGARHEGATIVPVALTNTPRKVAAKPTTAKRPRSTAAAQFRQPGHDQDEDAQNAQQYRGRQRLERLGEAPLHHGPRQKGRIVPRITHRHMTTVRLKPEPSWTRVCTGTTEAAGIPRP